MEIHDSTYKTSFTRPTIKLRAIFAQF